MGMKSTEGDIVQVQGGHILRATGRKDRHSKVYTSKGPRDRRVRLSAPTAIQFYDVQDRLGFDRPSKAVDWLLRKAKSSIDKLAELPPWQPGQEAEQNEGSSEMAIAEHSESSGYNFQLQTQLGDDPDDNNNNNHHNHHHHHHHHHHNNNNSAFIPSSIDNDAIAFFPTTTTSSSINFQSYPSQDLGLSLHSFQNHGLIHAQSQTGGNQTTSNDQTLFSGSNPPGFEANYHRILTWNNDSTTTDMNRGGFMVNSPEILGHGASAYSNRGTLQSSFSPSLRPWNDIPMASSENHDQKPQLIHQGSIFGSRFVSDALPGFCIPARIQEEDESHGVSSDRPSSPSPNSHH